MQIYVEEDELGGLLALEDQVCPLAYRKDSALKEYLKYLDYTKVFKSLLSQVMHIIKV